MKQSWLKESPVLTIMEAYSSVHLQIRELQSFNCSLHFCKVNTNVNKRFDLKKHVPLMTPFQMLLNACDFAKAHKLCPMNTHQFSVGYLLSRFLFIVITSEQFISTNSQTSNKLRCKFDDGFITTSKNTRFHDKASSNGVFYSLN